MFAYKISILSGDFFFAKVRFKLPSVFKASRPSIKIKLCSICKTGTIYGHVGVLSFLPRWS